MTASVKRYRYMRKLLNFEQMDFEFAFWQMTFLFINPQKVYRNFQHRKGIGYGFHTQLAYIDKLVFPYRNKITICT